MLVDGSATDTNPRELGPLYSLDGRFAAPFNFHLFAVKGDDF